MAGVKSGAVAALVVLGGLARGQAMLDEGTPQGKALVASFEEYYGKAGGGVLACALQKMPVQLDYNLMLWSGYAVSVAAEQFEGVKERGLLVFFRVTPEEARGRARYFAWRMGLPAAPAGASLKKVDFQFSGGFLLGPGRYRVEWMLMDGEGRRCRQSWQLKAKSGDVSAAVEPNTVQAIERGFWQGFGEGKAGGRALVLIHAAPLFPRRYVAKLSAWDRQVLMSSLSALLRDGGFRSAGVVVFDIERRRVVFRSEDFERRGLRQMGREMAALELGTVPRETLEKGNGPGPFLEEMLRKELKARPADRVIYLGGTWRGGPALPAVAADLKEIAPPATFLAYGVATMPSFGDSLTSLVKGLGGRVLNVHGPGDLAAAIRAVGGGGGK